MSLDQVRSFAKTVLEGQGLSEHAEAFDVESVPRQKLLNGAFHVELGTQNVLRRNVNNEVSDWPFTVRVMWTGFNRNSDKVSQGITVTDSIISQMTDPDAFLTRNIVHVFFDSREVRAFDEMNHDIITIELGFRARLVRGYA